MFKPIILFATYFLSAVILLATGLVLLRLTLPMAHFQAPFDEQLLLLWPQLPRFISPVGCLIGSGILFVKAYRQYRLFA